MEYERDMNPNNCVRNFPQAIRDHSPKITLTGPQVHRHAHSSMHLIVMLLPPTLGWLPEQAPVDSEIEFFRTARGHVQKARANLWA